jgi:hypothetical protein
VTPRKLIAILAGGFLAVAIVVGGTTWGAIALRTKIRYGTLADRGDPALTVEAGDRFTLTVPDRGPSVGDSWRASIDPAGAATLVNRELVPSNPIDRIFGPALGGGAGTRYFVFDTSRPGRLTVTLANCFQGCRDPDTQAMSESITWTVTVS